tara:strand:- start:2254 stop:2748 length:495 start_codon:yes stop_codon:yes gene_type:complete
MEEVKAIIMLEILGRPPEHIKKILNDIVDKLSKEKDVSITEKKIAEPKPVPEQEDIFSSFAEIELKTPIEKLMAICFGYMPSHIEIIYPEDLKMKNSSFNGLFNELMGKLHQYDELAKAMMMERQMIQKQIQDGEIRVKPLEKVSKGEVKDKPEPKEKKAKKKK